MAKKQSRKLAKVELTPRERQLVAEGLESEFFQIIRDKILPQRKVQISLTAIEADQTMQDIWYHRGMIYMCNWLPKFMSSETANLDVSIDYNNDDEVGAEDEMVS